MNQDFTKFPLLCKLVDCVTRFEGGGPGRNNPGNIRCPGNNTAIWNHLATGETSGFCNFVNEETGLYALREKFYNICTSESETYNAEAHKMFNVSKCENLTIYQTMQIYAPATDGNDPLHYATTIAGEIGVDKDFVIKGLLGAPVATPQPVPAPVASIPVPDPITPTQAIEIEQDLTVAQKVLQWVQSLFK